MKRFKLLMYNLEYLKTDAVPSVSVRRYWIFSAMLLIVMDFKLGPLITSVFSKIRDVLFAL